MKGIGSMIDIYICEDNEKQRNYLKSQIDNFIAFDQTRYANYNRHR